MRVADPMLPALAMEFGRDASEVASVITGFTVAYGVMQLVWGPLGDRLGTLRLIAWATVAAALGSLACALAPGLHWLSGARFVTGACCAAIIPLAIAHVGNTFAYEERQRALARLSSGTLSGMIAGQLIGGVATDTVGWRAGFAALALVFLAAGVATVRMQARIARARTAVAAGGSPFVAGLLSVLRDGWSRSVLTVALLEGALMFGPIALVPSWLHARTGMPLTAAGSAVAALALGGLLYMTTSRPVLARLDRPRLLVCGALVMVLGLATLAASVRLPGAGATWTAALAGCGIAGFGFYMLHNTMQTLATQIAPQARSTAVGLFAVSLFLGQSVGVLAAVRLDAAIGLDAVLIAASTLLALAAGALAAGAARRGA